MKKVLIGLIAFGVIAVGITAVMIQFQKNSVTSPTTSGDHTFSNIGDKEKVIEKTIDLYGFYDENDLVVEGVPYTEVPSEREITVPQIKGLKDKNVEEKINQNIREKAERKIVELVSGEKTNPYFHWYVNANFSNVLSLEFYISYQIGERYLGENFSLNYELLQGNELQFRELFAKDTDVAMIVRRMLYRELAENELWGGETTEYHETPYFDEITGTWLAKYHLYNWETGEEKEETKEYVPSYTDYDIEKMVKKIVKGNPVFSFTPYRLTLYLEDNRSADIRWMDIANDAVVYSKYLTKNSLYQEENVGAKKLLTCTNYYPTGVMRELDMKENNLFFDIYCTWDEVYNGNGTKQSYPAQSYLETKEQEEIEQLKREREKYRKLAKENPDKAYFLWGQTEIRTGSFMNEYYNPSLGYNEWTSDFNNLLEIERRTKVIVCDVAKREELLDKILLKYRYPNLVMYVSIYNEISEDGVMGGFTLGVPVEETVERHLYDVYTGKEIKDVKDIFIDKENYKEVLDSYNKNEEVANYVLHDDYISSDNEEQYCYIPLKDISKYIIVEPLRTEVLPNSSTEKIEREAITALSKEKLYRAYNEIFARHGHDFQMPEYKHYFGLWDWYHPIAGKTISLEELNEVEQYNVKLLMSVIEEK